MRWNFAPKNKYNNKKISINGRLFDSQKEANRYIELRRLEQAGLITDLEMQKKYVLQEAFNKNGKHYQAICYYADFVYKTVYEKQIIVEDVKAAKNFTTDIYKLKKKLFEYKYPDLTIKEIY